MEELLFYTGSICVGVGVGVLAYYYHLKSLGARAVSIDIQTEFNDL